MSYLIGYGDFLIYRKLCIAFIWQSLHILIISTYIFIIYRIFSLFIIIHLIYKVKFWHICRSPLVPGCREQSQQCCLCLSGLPSLTHGKNGWKQELTALSFPSCFRIAEHAAQDPHVPQRTHSGKHNAILQVPIFFDRAAAAKVKNQYSWPMLLRDFRRPTLHHKGLCPLHSQQGRSPLHPFLSRRWAEGEKHSFSPLGSSLYLIPFRVKAKSCRIAPRALTLHNMKKHAQ